MSLPRPANLILYTGLGMAATGMLLISLGAGEHGFKSSYLFILGPGLLITGEHEAPNIIFNMLQLQLNYCPSGIPSLRANIFLAGIAVSFVWILTLALTPVCQRYFIAMLVLLKLLSNNMLFYLRYGIPARVSSLISKKKDDLPSSQSAKPWAISPN